MAKSIKEISKKTESLIEQGKEADKKIQNCQTRVAISSSRVVVARRQLAAASEIDEEGRPAGDVESARAELSMAQNQLAASQRALSVARSDAERVKQQKKTHVREIDKHNQVERANLEKLRQLRSRAFGSDVAALTEGMAQRLNEAEESRVELLRSMGMDVTPEYVSVGVDESVNSTWRGGGFSAIDTSGSVQRYQGGTSQGIGSANGNIGFQGTEQNNASAKTILGRFFGKNKSERVETIDFNGFSIERNGMAGDRFFVKGNNYDSFCYFRNNHEEYDRSDINENRIINARDIEGIYINENEAYDRHLFWNRGKEYPVDSEMYFLEVASHIPEIRMRLEAGETADSIRNNPSLGTCYDYYFDTPIKVYQVDGYYHFSDAGRHRCMAAQKLGYDIPVKVIGKYSRKSDAIGTISQITNYESLRNYMDSKYSIQLEDSIGKLNLDTVKGAISGVERVINEYPAVGDFLQSGITSNSGVMSCTGSKLSFNPEYFSDDRKLQETCRAMSSRGFWVSNASTESIGVHEAAHGVEWALIQANSQYMTEAQKVRAWNDCTEATNIVREACENIKRTQYGFGKTSTELVRSISAYALENDSETMAEAFADVYANGENAKPLSKEIKRITRILMNKYKGES